MLQQPKLKYLVLFPLFWTIIVCTSLRNHETQRTQPNHQYWFSKDHKNVAGNDDRWDYCDYKCLALQNMNKNKDFVVVQFSALLKQRFSACYVKVGTGYILWSKVTSNAFYEQHCGEDYKDWIVEGDFNIDEIYGVGIGTQLTDADQQKMYSK